MSFKEDGNFNIDEDFIIHPKTYFYPWLTLITDPLLGGLMAVVMTCLSSLISRIARFHSEDFVPYILTGFVWWGY